MGKRDKVKPIKPSQVVQYIQNKAIAHVCGLIGPESLPLKGLVVLNQNHPDLADLPEDELEDVA